MEAAAENRPVLVNYPDVVVFGNQLLDEGMDLAADWTLIIEVFNNCDVTLRIA